MKFLLLTLTLAFAVASAEFSEETLMVDVSNSIAAMKKKGATEADCKDLAKTTCKEVVSERKTDQQMINKVQTGRHCVTKGQPGVTKAKAHYEKMKKILRTAQIEVVKASNLKVTITSQRFKSLKVGRCGFIFGSSSYLAAKKKYTRAQRIVVKYKGVVSEAWKIVVTMKKTAARMVKSCHCRTKAAYYKVWKVVTSKKRQARQAKAYAKCKMMSCVLNGTNISSAKCKGTLKSVTHKKLFSATARVSGCTAAKPAKKKVSYTYFVEKRRGARCSKGTIVTNEKECKESACGSTGGHKSKCHKLKKFNGASLVWDRKGSWPKWVGPGCFEGQDNEVYFHNTGRFGHGALGHAICRVASGK